MLHCAEGQLLCTCTAMGKTLKWHFHMISWWWRTLGQHCFHRDRGQFSDPFTCQLVLKKGWCQLSVLCSCSAVGQPCVAAASHLCSAAGSPPLGVCWIPMGLPWLAVYTTTILMVSFVYYTLHPYLKEKTALEHEWSLTLPLQTHTHTFCSSREIWLWSQMLSVIKGLKATI